MRKSYFVLRLGLVDHLHVADPASQDSVDAGSVASGRKSSQVGLARERSPRSGMAIRLAED
jgi:hypothetical protein